MSAIPATPSPTVAPEETLPERFDRLAKTWRAETCYLSSTHDKVAHPAFQEIVRMGPPVIPLVLRELEKGSGHWHQALYALTGEDPGPGEGRGNIERMRNAWLRWGKEKGYTC